MTDRVDLGIEHARLRDVADELRRTADTRGRVIDLQKAELADARGQLASLRAQRDAALARLDRAPKNEHGFDLLLVADLRATLGVQPEPDNG